MDGKRRRLLAVLIGIAIAAALAIPAVGAQTKELTVEPGAGAPGALQLDGLTYAQAKQRLDELNTITLPVDIEGLERIGVTDVRLVADDDEHSLTLAGTATRFDVAVTADWADGEETTPEITIGAETDDVTLADLNPAWDRGDVRFEHVELQVSTTDPSVRFAGRLELSGRIAEAFAYAGYSGDVEVEGSLGSDASALTGNSAPGLRLQATLGKSPDAPAWLAERTSVYAFSTEDGLTIDEDITVAVEGTRNRFQGRVAVSPAGAIEGELRLVGALDAPFGLDAIENLTLRVPEGSLAFDVMVDGSPVHVEASMAGTFSIDGSIPVQKLAALGGELLGTPVEAVPGTEGVTLDHVSFTVARGLFSVGAKATVRDMRADAVMTLRNGKPLLGLRLNDVRMSSLVPNAGETLGRLELPELTLAATTLTGVEDPTAQEQAVFGDGPLSFTPGLNVAGRMPLRALGLDADDEVELAGTLGASPSLDATIPAAAFAELLPDWVTPTGATKLSFRGRAASFSTAADVAVGGRTFSTTIAGALARDGQRTTVNLKGEIAGWQHPFGASWLTLNRATVDLDASFGGGLPATVDAAVTASTQLNGRTFELEFGLSKAAGTTARLTARYRSELKLRDVAGAFPALSGVSADIASNPELRDLSVGPIAATVTLGGGASAFELTAVTRVKGLTSDLLISVRPGGGFTLGLKPRGSVDLQKLAPIPGPKFTLTSGALVLGSETVTRPVAQLTEGEFDFFQSLYGCDGDACPQFKSLSQTRGLKLLAALDLGDDVEKMASSIGIQASGNVLIEGQIPIFGGSDLSLSASLGEFRFPNAPDWFDGGSVRIEIGSDGLHFVGDLGLKIQREGAQWMPRCAEGVVIDGRCYDKLGFKIDAGVKLSPAPSLTLSGVLKADKIWRNAFGQDWLQIKRVALQLGVTLKAGPEVTMGFQGDVTIGTKDVAAAVKVGLSPAPPPLFVRPNLIGFSAASKAGIALSDIVWLNEQITGTRLNTSSMPDISLRNLFLQYSQETDADLCLTQGVRFNADLYAGGAPAIRSADDGDANGCRTLDVSPETRQTCLDRKADGCLASVYGRLDSGGIVAGGELSAFELGPIAFDDTSVGLALTPSQQRLRLKGGVRIGTGGYEFASGRADLDLSRDGFAFSGDAALFNNAFHGYLEASAPFNLRNPSFKVKAWLRADARGAINSLVGAKAENVRPLVVGLGRALSIMTGNGSVPNIRELPALLESAGATVPAEVRTMTKVLGDAQAKIAEYNLPALGLDKALNGFSFGVPGVPGWRNPDTCLFTVVDGRCWTTPPFWGIPGIPGTWIRGGCVNYEINGQCYFTKPITITVPGICSTIGVPAWDCSWQGLMRRFVRPALLSAAERATGIDFDDASFETAISTIVTKFASGAGSIVNVDCAYFEADASALAQGNVNVALAAKARLFGLPLEFGSAWNFRAAGGSPEEVVKNLLRSVFSPSSIKCPDVPAGHEQVRNDVESSTLKATLAEGKIDEGGEAQVSATFDASALRYPAVAVKWGDGSATVIPAGEARTVTATHRYTDSATYPVTVVVQDAGGYAAPLSLLVRNVAPALSALEAEPADEGAPVTVRGRIADPGARDGQTVRVDWRDGTPIETREVGRDFVLTHRYADDRRDIARIEVTDADGARSNGEVPITVRNAAPSRIGIKPLKIVTPQGEVAGEPTEGAHVTYGVDFTDPGENDPHTITVDWGDGTPVKTVQVGAGPRRVELPHKYADDGDYAVRIGVVDEDGARGEGAERVRVRNVAPALQVKAERAQGVARLAGTVSDPGERDAQIVRIDWGADVQEITLKAGERTFTAEHAFAAGTYPVAVDVRDGKDASQRVKVPVTVG